MDANNKWILKIHFKWVESIKELIETNFKTKRDMIEL